MEEKNQRAEQFRKHLIRSLNQYGDNFDFSACVEKSGVKVQLATSVAELVFAQFFDQVREDGEITDHEHRQLRKLANRLEIGDDRRVEIEKKVGNRAYREQLRDAQADGVVTDEEREALRKLSQSLELARMKDRTPRESDQSRKSPRGKKKWKQTLETISKVLFVSLPVWLLFGVFVIRLFGIPVSLKNKAPSKFWFGNLLWMGGFAFLLMLAIICAQLSGEFSKSRRRKRGNRTARDSDAREIPFDEIPAKFRQEWHIFWRKSSSDKGGR